MCLPIFYPILSMRSIHLVFCKSNFSPLKLPGSSASPPKTPTLQRLLLRRMKFFAVSENPGACTGPTNIALGNYSLIEVNQEDQLHWLTGEWSAFAGRVSIAVCSAHVFCKDLGVANPMHASAYILCSIWLALPVHRHPSKSSCSGSPKKGGLAGVE